jgi:guanylate kinase
MKRMKGAERGVLIVLSAPSGAGKTTLVRELLRRMPSLRFSVSYTTRSPRPNEQDGVDYFFVSEAQFRGMIERGEFLEYANVFDHWYGTSRTHVEGLLNQGHSVLLEIDWQGARQVFKSAPDAVSVFILPPSVAELTRRLRGRRSDTEAVIQRRLRDAVSDMEHWAEFDYVLVNAEVGTAVDQFLAILRGEGAPYRTSAASAQASAARILRPAAGG